MKTKQLLSFLVLMGLFQIGLAQTTLTVDGQLTNTNGVPIDIWLTVDAGGTYLSQTATTNATGYYSANFTVNSTQGIIYMHADDCNYDSLYSVQSFSPASNTVTIPTFDYCPASNSNCSAYFSVDQAYVNNQAVSGTLVVTDSSVGSNLTYSWVFGDGFTGAGTQLTHTYAGNGPYILCLTIDDGAGCVDTYCDTISVDSSGMIIESVGFDLVIGDLNLGLLEKDHASSIKVYPNPATDIMTIEFTETTAVFNQINLYDLSGKLVLQETINHNSTNLTTLDLTSIEPGTYLIQMTANSGTFNQKIVIK